MDDELDPADENVNSVLAQESSELFEILCSQSQTTLLSLWETTPRDAAWLGSAAASALVPEHISAMLEHFRRSSAAECCSFLQRVCLLCDNVPMHLESKLMSVAGNLFSECETPKQHISIKSLQFVSENIYTTLRQAGVHFILNEISILCFLPQV